MHIPKYELNTWMARLGFRYVCDDYEYFAKVMGEPLPGENRISLALASELWQEMFGEMKKGKIDGSEIQTIAGKSCFACGDDAAYKVIRDYEGYEGVVYVCVPCYLQDPRCNEMLLEKAIRMAGVTCRKCRDMH